MNTRILKRHLTAAAMLVTGVGSAQALPIPGLFNTGVDNAGVALSSGATDPHYSILVPDQPAVVIRDDVVPAVWVGNTNTYRWVWQGDDGAPVNVTRTFRTQFDLSGLDPATAQITGQWATDNIGDDVLINGASTGNSCNGFESLCSFSVTSGFVSGINTLDFVVRDLGVVAGFLVASIQGTANAAGGGSTVPEPATLAILGPALPGLWALRRRRRAA